MVLHDPLVSIVGCCHIGRYSFQDLGLEHMDPLPSALSEGYIVPVPHSEHAKANVTPYWAGGLAAQAHVKPDSWMSHVSNKSAL